MEQTTVEVGEYKQQVREGASIRHFTRVISKQTWHEGSYAGKSYRITDVYVSPEPGHRGQHLKSSSQPWEGGNHGTEGNPSPGGNHRG